MSNLLPMHYSTVNTCKRKQKKKSVSMTEAEHKHAKFLKKMGVGGRSSVGRAGALQASGQEFDSPHLHQEFASVAQKVEQLICNHQVVGSTPTASTILIKCDMDD